MKKYVMSSMVLILVLTACLPSLGGGDEPAVDTVATSVALTQAAQQVPPTQTPEPDVTATAKTNANCRSGPDVSFDYLASLDKGASAKVIGKNTVGDTWWQLELSDGTKCWVQEDSLTVTGNTDDIPEIKSPPTPTPVPPASLWAGTWTIYYNNWITNDPSDEQIFTAIWTMTGPNTITGYLTGTMCTSATTALTISADGYKATGTQTWSGGICGAVRELHLTLDPNKNQFRGRMIPQGGSMSTDWYYAGSRSGYAAPEPRR